MRDYIIGGVILAWVLYLIYLVCRRLRPIRWLEDDKVSEKWIEDNLRDEGKRGIDGVSWQWPVRKIANEVSWYTRQNLRQKAG